MKIEKNLEKFIELITNEQKVEFVTKLFDLLSKIILFLFKLIEDIL